MALACGLDFSNNETKELTMDKTDVCLFTILGCLLLAFLLVVVHAAGRSSGRDEIKAIAVASGSGCYVVEGDKSVFTFKCKGN